MHAVPNATAEVAAMPGEAPVAAGNPTLDVVELIHIAHATGGTAGDTLAFWDQLFFPLLNLYEGDLPPLEATELEDLEAGGVLQAMAEVLPYNAPEGQLLESLGDDELRPLAPGHAQGGEYDGALYLVERGRLRTLLESFDGQHLLEQKEKFLSAWFRALEPDGTDATYGAWRRGRDHTDGEELSRFATAFAELKAVIGLCDENGLDFGLIFYEA
jgi:hypothetical protein